MEHQDYKDLLPLAAVDKLELQEARDLTEHLSAGCAECQAELDALREAAAAMAFALDPVQPSAEQRVWQRVAARLEPQTAAPRVGLVRRSGVTRGWRWASAALAAGLVGVVVYAGVISRQLAQMRGTSQLQSARMAQMRSQLASARGAVATLQQVLGERVRMEQVLTAPDLQLTRLQPLSPNLGGGALIAVSQRNHAALIQASGLPRTPPGKAYEVWWITREHGPLPAGLFRVGQSRAVVAPVAMPPSDQHVLLSAVTLEPAAGVSKPSGQMYLKGAPT